MLSSLAAVVLAVASAVVAQVPAGGSSILSASSAYGTTPFNLPPTFTPSSDFASATAPVNTVLSGVGPSGFEGTALFTYPKPTATVPGFTNTGVLANLTSSGQRTEATAAFSPPITPDYIINNPNAAADLRPIGAAGVAVAAAMAVLLA